MTLNSNLGVDIINKQSDRIRQLRLAPGYLILSIYVFFIIVMFGWIFAASLSTTKEIFSGNVLKFATGLHFENYYNAWTAQNISVFFCNSLLYAGAGTALTLLISAPAAYVLARMHFKLNKTIQTCFSVAMSVPLIMIILPLYGTVSHLNLLGSNFSTRCLLVFLYAGINIPYTVIYLISFFSSISSSFEEAALIDGCTREKAFWKIMLPLAQSGFVTVSVFVFMRIWNEYFMSLILASGQDVRPVAVGLRSLIDSMRYTGNWSGLFASVVLVSLPTFILYVVMSKRIINGITQGGVKG